MITSTIYKGFQIHIPKEVREKKNINEKDQIIWNIDGDNIILQVKKQRSLHDLVALATSDREVDAVELKKKSQRGAI